MWAYIILVVMWIFILFAWLIPVTRKHIIYEIYEALGLGGSISLLILGWSGILQHYNIKPLRIIGHILYIVALLLAIPTFVTLKLKGKPKSGWEHTSIMISSNVYSIVRHPLYLSTAIWAIALMFIFQSLPSILLGIASIYCCWMASKKEDKYNIKKFGDSYRKYMQKVPRWNVIKGLLRFIKK